MSVSVSSATKRYPYNDTSDSLAFAGFPGLCVDPENGDLLLVVQKKVSAGNNAVLHNRWLRSADAITWTTDHDAPSVTVNVPSAATGRNRTVDVPQAATKMPKSGGGYHFVWRENFDDFRPATSNPVGHLSAELKQSDNGTSGVSRFGAVSFGLSSIAQASRILPYSGGWFISGEDFRTPIYNPSTGAANTKTIRWAKPMLRKLNLDGTTSDLLNFPTIGGYDWDGNGTGSAGTFNSAIPATTTGNSRYPTRIEPNEMCWTEDKDGHMVAVFRTGGVWDGVATGAANTSSKYWFVRARKNTSTGKYDWPTAAGADFKQLNITSPAVTKAGAPVHPELVHFTAGQDDVLVLAVRRDASMAPGGLFYSTDNGVSWTAFAGSTSFDTANDPYYARVAVLDTAQAHVKRVVVFGSTEADSDPGTADFKITSYDFTVTGTASGGGTYPNAPTFDKAAGSYQTSVTVAVSAPTGCTTRTTTDGSTPTASNGSTASSFALSTVGTTTLKSISIRTSDSAVSQTVASRAYTITSAPVTPDAPTITPNGGSFTGSVSVTLNAEDDVTIRYTTDGSTPTTSTGYTAAPGASMTLVDTGTVKAIAVRSGAPSGSSVVSATFTEQTGGGTPGADEVLTGTYRATSASSDSGSGGTVAWSNPSWAYSVADSRASASLANNAVSHYLKTGGHGVPAATDPASTAKEVVFKVERSQSANQQVKDHRVRLVKDGTVTSADVAATGTVWPTADGVATYTFNEAALSAAGVTAADVSESGFGLAISTQNPGASAASFARLDDVYISSVTYATPATQDTVAPPAPTLTPASGPKSPGTVTVTMTDDEPGVTIRYGISFADNPNYPLIADADDGSVYSTPYAFTMPASGVARVRAIAVDAAGNVSEPTTVEYTSEDATAPNTPVILPDSGVVTDTVMNVSITSDDPEATIRYTASKSTASTLPADPTATTGTVYTGPFTFTVDATGVRKIKAIAIDASGNVSPVAFETWTLT